VDFGPATLCDECGSGPGAWAGETVGGSERVKTAGRSLKSVRVLRNLRLLGLKGPKEWVGTRLSSAARDVDGSVHATASSSGAIDAGVRISHLDWLRILAVLGVFLFHAVHPFDTFDWHVKNVQQSEAISLLLAFLFPWGLGFFFLIAGAASFLALRTRTTGQYVQERLRRLLVPYVVGWFLLSPLQSYIEDVHKGLWGGTYISFIPHFFLRAWREMVNLDEGLLPLPLGWSYHLWFLLYLLWFSLLGLPFFLLLRRSRGSHVVRTLGDHARWRAFPLLFALPIALLHVAVRAASPDEHAWGEFIYYAGFFLGGYLVMSEPRLLAAIRRDVVPALILGALGFGLLIASGVIEWTERWMEEPSYSWRYAMTFFLFSVQAWAWALAVLGLGLRLRTFARPLPRWAASAAMPFFIVHQPVILAVAFVVVGMGVALAVKVTLVVLFSFLGASAIAGLGTRYRTTRTLLGIRA
jgi:glucans biosynthesis protein C